MTETFDFGFGKQPAQDDGPSQQGVGAKSVGEKAPEQPAGPGFDFGFGKSAPRQSVPQSTAPPEQEGVVGALKSEGMGILSANPISKAYSYAKEGDVLRAVSSITSLPGLNPIEQIDHIRNVISSAKQRSAEQRSVPYQAVADFAQGVGIVDPTAMEEAAKRGDTSAVATHAAVPAVLAIAGPVVHELTPGTLSEAIKTHEAAQRIFEQRMREVDTAAKQAQQSTAEADLARQREKQGVGTRQETVAAENNASEATANAGRAMDALKKAGEARAQAAPGVEINRLRRRRAA